MLAGIVRVEHMPQMLAEMSCTGRSLTSTSFRQDFETKPAGTPVDASRSLFFRSNHGLEEDALRLFEKTSNLSGAGRVRAGDRLPPRE
jgi:hypothetical protein